MVETKDHGFICMADLQIDDYVTSGNGNKYTQVYCFGHRNPNYEETFEFDNENNNSSTIMSMHELQISPMHLIFIARDNWVEWMHAKDVVIGDILSEKQVNSIHYMRQKGVYALLTQSGDIVVNGMIASILMF
jgi:Hint module